ncbi:MAG: S49 family peptidase [Gammaproteobacteria bacterium]|nr:S49 family peptidase [Gammaproteobacteria bacterium]
MQDTENSASSNSSADVQNTEQNWERQLLTRLAMASLHEQRRTRRWRIVFIILFFGYIGVLMAMSAFSGKGTVSTGSHTAVVDLLGVIEADGDANAQDTIDSLRDAFEDSGTKGVILRINSPGGSPVQSAYIYDEMVRLRAEYPDVPLYAVIEDVGASGGYYVAAGAEKIYAAKASIVGSIGVRMDGFGFVKTMDKLGIERRLLTAGNNKGMLDPFTPVNVEQQQHVQNLLDQVHKQFIDAVKAQRGNRLKEDETLFTGLIWTGEQGINLGLVDELASVDYVAREVIGEKELQHYGRKKTFMETLLSEVRNGVQFGVQAMLEPRLR